MAAFGNNTREIQDRPPRWETWEKVVIRALTNHEHQKIMYAIQKGKGKNKRGLDGLELTDDSKFAELTLKACIVSWTFTTNGEEDGEIAEINSETFNNLPKHYSDFIQEEIAEFTPDDSFLDRDKSS